MNTWIVLGSLAIAILAYVNAESCTVNSDCASTTCTVAASVICQHPDPANVHANGGLCTCAATGGSGCSIQSDCFVDTVNLTCANPFRHCYDGNCICDRFPDGGFLG